MRMLLPRPDDRPDLRSLYGLERPTHTGRPHVVGLMVTSADGAATVGGLSGGLGGDGDHQVFEAVRATVDAVVVGSGTATAEDYGPVTTGRGGRPARLVIVSGRLSLEPTQRLFTGDHPPLILHPPSAPADRRADLSAVAELEQVPDDGHGGADAPGVLAALYRRGHRVVGLEGGPTLNGGFVAADLLDEMCLTVDPRIVGGESPRIVTGRGEPTARDWDMGHLLEHDGVLFWRLLRRR